MTELTYLFAVVAVLGGVVTSISIWAPRRLWLKLSALGTAALFLPVAFAALLLQASRPPLMRAAGAVLIGSLTAASLVDHMTVIQRASFAPPPARFGPLAERLEARGVHLARAGYWRSYVLTFLTGERVIVASNELQRIVDYQRAVDRASEGVVTIQETPCEGQQPFDVVGRWHLCQ